MPIMYHIFMRTETADEVVAEITEEGVVTGAQAEVTRSMLKRYGYPQLPLKEAIQRYVSTCSTYFGYERVGPQDGNGRAEPLE
jgi:hypothetical protein